MFDVVAAGLDRPTLLEIVEKTAYVVTLGGEIWKIGSLPRSKRNARSVKSTVVVPPGERVGGRLPAG